MAAAEVLTESRNVFYVYVHRRETDGSVFYVGKGSGGRSRRTANRNPHWRNIVAKHGHTCEIVRDCLSEDEAFAFERELIAQYGRDGLCNLTDGGEGPSGHVKSESAKLAVSRRHKGEKRSPEWRAAISAGLKGGTRSSEQRAKISAKLKGQVLSEETRAKMSASRKGLRRSEETKARMRQSWADPVRRRERGSAMQHDGTPVICVETGTRFEKMRDASNWLRETQATAKRPSLTRACKDSTKTAYGYHWRYA